MADNDWDTVVKIGSRAGGGGGGPRQTTVKSKSQLNAAQRSGNIVATEKKYGTANAASSSGSGQFLTKVDRSDDIVKPKTGDKDLARYISDLRIKLGMNRTALAQATRVPAAEIEAIEKGQVVQPKWISQIESGLGIYVRGVNKGQKKGKNGKHWPKLFAEETK